MPELTQYVTSHRDIFKAIQQARKLKIVLRNILLAGPPGVGKTTLAFMVADLLKQPAHKIQYHAELTPSEIFGIFVPDGTKFKWEPGPLDLAYNNGGVLIHDEIIEASGPAKTFLYGAFDNGRGGEIDYIGRKFKPHPQMMNFATMNGWPYEGGLPDPLLDRFDAVFIILKPSPKQLELLEPDLREICSDAYETAKDPMLGPALTYRVLMSFQNLRKLLPLEQAALSACRGNAVQTGSFLEVLALGSTEEDDDDLMDDDEEDDE